MHGKLLCAALALYVSGCGDSQPTTRPRGLLPGEATPAPALAPPAPPPRPPPAPPPSTLGSPFDKPDPGALQAPPEQVVEQPAQAAPVVDAGKPRDLPAELAERMGSPTSCLDLAQAVESGGRLNIVVIAEVMPSGRITRAQASAPDQPASALRCLENKATSAGLKGPVPGAPLSVTATLPIEVASQPTQR